MKNRMNYSVLLALLMSIVMILTMTPALAWAAADDSEDNDGEDEGVTVDEMYFNAEKVTGSASGTALDTGGDYIIAIKATDLDDEEEADLYYALTKSVKTDDDGNEIKDDSNHFMVSSEEQDVTFKEGSGKLIADELSYDDLVWSYNGKNFVNVQKTSTDNMLYIDARGINGALKYQNDAAKTTSYDGKYLTSKSADGKKTYYLAYDSGDESMDDEESEDEDSGEIDTSGFTTTTKKAEAVKIVLFRLSPYTVKFDMNGQAVSGPADQKVKYNDKLTAPAEPGDELHIFRGWFTDKACSADSAYNFDTIVRSDFTLYAKWEIFHRVSFDMQGVGGETTAQIIKDGEAVAEPEAPAAPEGYIFGGWYVDKAGTTVYDFSTPVTADITIFAKWSIDPEANEQIARDAAAAETDKAASPENLVRYNAEQASEIAALAGEYAGKIKAAATTAEIQALLDEFNAKIAALPTTEEVSRVNAIAVKIKSAKAGKRKMTVSWKADADNFDGYQLSYRIKGKKWKSVNLSGAAKSKKIFKKLKKGKRYQAKVRGYKLYGSEENIKIYGKYSKTKTTKKIK